MKLQGVYLLQFTDEATMLPPVDRDGVTAAFQDDFCNNTF